MKMEIAVHKIYKTSPRRRSVRLNALAVTIALLFWGWAWGAVGFILAIPIVATAKVICDNVEGWEPVGRWLGSA